MNVFFLCVWVQYECTLSKSRLAIITNNRNTIENGKVEREKKISVILRIDKNRQKNSFNPHFFQMNGYLKKKYLNQLQKKPEIISPIHQYSKTFELSPFKPIKMDHLL